MNTAERFERNVKIIEDYNLDERISDIASKHGVTPATVMNVIRDGRRNGTVTRLPKSRRSDNTERDTLIVELYKEGAVMEEIASRYGISRERVRQIISSAGVPARSYSDRHLVAYRVWAEKNGDIVNAVFDRQRSISGVVNELHHHPTMWVRRFLAPRKHEVVRSHGAQRFWTDDRVLHVLQEASEDGILTITRYRKWRESGVMVEGRTPPTHTLVVWRFGSWNAALERAGLRSADRSVKRTYTRSWTRGDAITAVRSYTRESLSSSKRPTLSGYEDWVRRNPNNPSASYLRYLTGMQWSEILREALG